METDYKPAPANVGGFDKHAARELELYIRNDRGMYDNYTRPAWSKTAKLIAKGTYNREAAFRMWRRIADAGAKAYRLEHGSMTDKWNELFPVAVRDEVARRLRRHFETETKLECPDCEEPLTCLRASRDTDTPIRPPEA